MGPRSEDSSPPENTDRDDEALFRALYRPLRRFAAQVGPSEIEPDDLVQEALARTLDKHRLCDLDNPEAYLRRVILNLCTAAIRRRRPWQRARLRLAQPTSEIQPVPSDLADLDQLDPVDRAVMWLVHIEGHSHQEAADLLGLTEQASRSRASRSRKQLQRSLRNEEDSP
jgi:RNA polymerase sigma factor (sigma-70 family)